MLFVLYVVASAANEVELQQMKQTPMFELESCVDYLTISDDQRSEISSSLSDDNRQLYIASMCG